MCDGKQIIIDRFNANVRGQRPVAQGNAKHDGKYGHWLERKMGSAIDGANEADLFGYEMKCDTTSKTTFGDWSADYYIFKHTNSGLNRSQFLLIFGKPNMKKKGRPSWSGEPCPKITGYNRFGQILIVDNDNNIYAVYSYSKDLRTDKEQIVPTKLQQNYLILAKWGAEVIKKKLERKFNQKGWFKCKLGRNGTYEKIAFGAPINIDTWIELVKQGIVFFDSGMYEGNIRPYSQWRANNSFWDSCIVEEY